MCDGKLSQARHQVIRAEKEQRKERWLEERIKRNQHTALQMSEECSNSHLDLQKHMRDNMRMSQIVSAPQNVSAPPSEVTLPESGVFEQPSNANFHA